MTIIAARRQNKTPGQISPGHEPVKFQNNYRQVQGRSQCYFGGGPPVRDLLATLPTRTGKAVDPTGFEPAPWNMTGSCAAIYTTGPEGTLRCGRAARKRFRHKRR